VLTRIFAPLFHSIRGRLILLTAAVVIPAALLAALLVYEAHTDERAIVERELIKTSQALSLVVDRQLGQAVALLQGLATSPYLKRGDFEAFYRQARAALGDSEASIVIGRPDGSQLLNSRLPFGTELPAFDVPEAMRRALDRDDTYVSNLIGSATGLDRLLMVTIPVVVQGERYGLALALPPASLSSVLADQNFPIEWVAAIIDRNGTIAARNRRSDEFVGGQATPDIRALVRSGSKEGIVESVTLDGMSTLAGYNRSPNSGWTVIIGAPTSALLANAQRLLLMVLGVSSLLIALGVAMALWLGRGVVRSLETLLAQAAALGRGEPPPQRATGMRETDQVAEALHDSATRLQAREEDLKRLNETLEARVEEATETLVQARKLEAVGRLTGGVAHDFNNLLTAVRVNLDLLIRRLDDEKLLKFVTGARQATDRGVRLIAQLLAFARKQRLQPAPVDVNAVVQEMGDLMRSTLGGAVAVESALAPELPAAFADRTQLELIIMNLAINARDAMESGGIVRIETGRTTVSEPAIRPEEPAPGDYIVLTVADTGSGMPPEVLERVFEPFFTTKSPGKGSGLGLPQVLGIVQQLGGGLHIESEVGRGTRMQIFLPQAAAEVAAAAAAPHEEAADLNGLRVLLVDDDDDVRTATATLLQDLGCTVFELEGGAAALDRLDGLGGLDVALVDYAMPGMNGIELAEHLGRVRPRLPILLMSGYMQTRNLERVWPDAVLQKPFAKEHLALRLAETAVAGAGAG
jgi:signal transduction histidine kinase